MKELLKSWKRSYKALQSNPMNVDPGISAGYLACLELCIQQLEASINEKNKDLAACEWSNYRKHYGIPPGHSITLFKAFMAGFEAALGESYEGMD